MTKSGDGFSLIDFAVSYKHTKNVHLNAGVNNIFNKAYYEHLNRRAVGTAMNLFEPGRVFFINLIVNI